MLKNTTCYFDSLLNVGKVIFKWESREVIQISVHRNEFMEMKNYVQVVTHRRGSKKWSHLLNKTFNTTLGVSPQVRMWVRAKCINCEMQKKEVFVVCISKNFLKRYGPKYNKNILNSDALKCFRSSKRRGLRWNSFGMYLAHWITRSDNSRCLEWWILQPVPNWLEK